MLSRLMTEPVLVRELVCNARDPETSKVAYPGLGWMLGLSLLTIIPFVIFGDTNSLYSSCHFLVITVFAQMWLLFARSGSYAASSMAKDSNQGAFSVLLAAPLGLLRLLSAKVVGTLLPLTLELLLLAPIMVAVFCLLGEVPLSYYLKLFSFQILVAVLGATIGLFLGDLMKNETAAVGMYRQFAYFVGFIGLCSSTVSMAAPFFSIIFVLCALLIWAPRMSPRWGSYGGCLAICFMIALPVLGLVDFGPFYEYVDVANPFVVMEKSRPIDFLEKNTGISSDLCSEYRAQAFFCRAFRRRTGVGMPFGPEPTERLCLELSKNPEEASIFGFWYWQWRCQDLMVMALIYALIIAVLGITVLIRVKRSCR